MKRLHHSIRVVVCGLGNIGRIHLDNLRSLRGCEVAGVFDQDETAAENSVDGMSCRVYSNWEGVLADESVDAVIVATPGKAHRAGVLSALKANKHVFVEKPLADDLADSAAIHHAAKQRQLVVQVGFCERFNPSFIEGRHAVATIGPVRSIQSSRVTPLSLSNPQWGLGALDTAIHNFDLILWLSGQRPISVQSFGVSLYPDIPRPTAITTIIQFESRLTAVDHVAWLRDRAHPLAACARARMAIYGEQGIFDIDLSTRPASLLTSDSFTQPDSVILGRSDYFSCLRLQLDAFLTAIETGSPSPVTTLDGLRAEYIATAAQKSLATGTPTFISEESWSPQ